MKTIARLVDFLFSPIDEGRSRRGQLLFLVVVFMVGMVHWYYFIHCHHGFRQSIDWNKDYKYFEVLREAIRTWKIPFHVSEMLVVAETNRYLAVPESLYLLSPQVPLLAFMHVQPFVMAHTLILYTAGFAGCLLIRRRYRLTPFAFFMLFSLFNFNGYIASHLAAGHTGWYGYFLLPYFALYTLDIVEQRGTAYAPVKLAVALMFMVFQGGVHIFCWCMMFLGLLLVSAIGRERRLLTAMILAALLSVCRMLPAVWSTKIIRPFLWGYPSVWEFVSSLIGIRNWDYMVAGKLHVWEYDMYISVIGLAFILYFGVYLRFRRDEGLSPRGWRSLDFPLVVMTLLSFADFYELLVSNLPTRLFAVERVPSRFIIVPFLFVLIVSCVRARKVFLPLVKNAAAGLLVGAGALLMFGFLMSHSRVWRLGVLKVSSEPHSTWNDVHHIIDVSDPTYVWIVFFATAISLATLAAILAGLCVQTLKNRRNRAAGGAAVGTA